MKTFWEYLQKEETDLPSNIGDTDLPNDTGDTTLPVDNANQSNYGVSVPQPTTQGFKPKIKPWKAKKSDVMTFWRSLAPNMPLQLKTIDNVHKGSTLQEDTLRITGSKEFISTVLSRLKDFLTYENVNSKLVIDYRQNAKSLKPGEKNSYLFYLNVRNRK